MTNDQFKQAVQLANGDAELNVDIGILLGCALPEFEPVVCSIEVVAKFLRWQAKMFNGLWDWAVLTECQEIVRRKVTIV